jgi:hypothetical protein
MRAFTFSVCVATTVAVSICDAQAPRWSAGVAAGQLKFSDGSSESAIGATIGAHVWDWLDVSVNPTYARAHSVAIQSSPTVVIPARSVSGFTDLPLNFGISHALPGTWSPSIGFSLGVTLPTGDTASLGSGRMGVGASASVGISPSEDVWFSAGAGRSLSNGYSAALASSSSTSMALSAGTTAGPFNISASLSGDVGATSSGYEGARSIAAGMALPVGAATSLSLDGSVGLTTGSPTWAYSVGFGTRPSGIVAASVAPYQRLRQAFGAGTGTKNKPKTGKP